MLGEEGANSNETIAFIFQAKKKMKLVRMRIPSDCFQDEMNGEIKDRKEKCFFL